MFWAIVIGVIFIFVAFWLLARSFHKHRSCAAPMMPPPPPPVMMAGPGMEDSMESEASMESMGPASMSMDASMPEASMASMGPMGSMSGSMGPMSGSMGTMGMGIDAGGMGLEAGMPGVVSVGLGAPSYNNADAAFYTNAPHMAVY
jgi:hypothetical protein